MLVLGGLAVSLSSTLCWTWRKGKGWWTSITASGSCGPGEWTWCKRRYDTSCQSLSVLWLGPQGLSWFPTSQSQGEEKHCKFPPRNSLEKKMIYLAICFLPSLLFSSLFRLATEATAYNYLHVSFKPQILTNRPHLQKGNATLNTKSLAQSILPLNFNIPSVKILITSS